MLFLQGGICARVFVRFLFASVDKFDDFVFFLRPCGDCVLSYPCVVDPERFWLLKAKPNVLELVKTTEPSTRNVEPRERLSDGGTSTCEHGRGSGCTG